MRKLGEVLTEAIRTGDASTVGRVVDFLRWKGLDYAAQYRLAHKLTGIDPAEWDGLLYEADEEGTG